METRTAHQHAHERPGRLRGHVIPVIAALLLCLVGMAGAPAGATAPAGASAAVGAGTTAAATAAAAATGGLFTSLPPRRLLDTRSGLGAPAAKVGPDATLHLQVGGRGGVPSTGVAAVVLNVTVTSPSRQGHITVYGDGTARPITSNVNFRAWQTVPNLVVTPVGSNGRWRSTTRQRAPRTSWPTSRATTSPAPPPSPGRSSP